MKFIEDEKFVQLTQDLTDAVFGTRVINGRIECFSCKRAGGDKKYAHELAEKFTKEIEISDAQWKEALTKNSGNSDDGGVDKRRNDVAHFANKSSSLRVLRKGRSSSAGSLSDLSTSPLGDFHRPVTQRLLTDLILTLNASFPDYDFSSARPDCFQRLRSSTFAVNRANEKLSDFALSEKGPEFLNDLWRAIDDVVLLKETEIYSFDPEDDSDCEFLSALTDGGEARCSSDALWSFNYFFVNKILKRIVLFTCVQSSLRCDAYDSGLEVGPESSYSQVEFDLQHFPFDT